MSDEMEIKTGRGEDVKGLAMFTSNLRAFSRIRVQWMVIVFSMRIVANV